MDLQYFADTPVIVVTNDGRVILVSVMNPHGIPIIYQTIIIEGDATWLRPKHQYNPSRQS
jgi:hypothetical protein